jgi:DNA-binding transcriptional LysR family regulator
MNKSERKPVNSDLLRTFAVIAEQGHLTAASEILGRTQSAISVQLRKLEDDLGVALFTRTPQGMVLTPSGALLVPAARAALVDLSEVRRLFDDPLQGTIRVGIPDDFDDLVLERVLASFARQNPGVEVNATSGCTSGFKRMIEKDQLDVAVVSNAQKQGGLFLSVEHTVWAVEKSTVLDRNQTVPLVLLDRACWWKDIATDALEASAIAYRVAFRSSSFASLKAAIRAGIGVGIMPKSNLDPAMRVVGQNDGFPALAAAHRCILTNENTDPILRDAMVDALRGLGDPTR